MAGRMNLSLRWRSSSNLLRPRSLKPVNGARPPSTSRCSPARLRLPLLDAAAAGSPAGRRRKISLQDIFAILHKKVADAGHDAARCARGCSASRSGSCRLIAAVEHARRSAKDWIAPRKSPTRNRRWTESAAAGTAEEDCPAAGSRRRIPNGPGVARDRGPRWSERDRPSAAIFEVCGVLAAPQRPQGTGVRDPAVADGAGGMMKQHKPGARSPKVATTFRTRHAERADSTRSPRPGARPEPGERL